MKSKINKALIGFLIFLSSLALAQDINDPHIIQMLKEMNKTLSDLKELTPTVQNLDNSCPILTQRGQELNLMAGIIEQYLEEKGANQKLAGAAIISFLENLLENGCQNRKSIEKSIQNSPILSSYSKILDLENVSFTIAAENKDRKSILNTGIINTHQIDANDPYAKERMDSESTHLGIDQAVVERFPKSFLPKYGAVVGNGQIDMNETKVNKFNYSLFFGDDIYILKKENIISRLTLTPGDSRNRYVHFPRCQTSFGVIHPRNWDQHFLPYEQFKDVIIPYLSERNALAGQIKFDQNRSVPKVKELSPIIGAKISDRYLEFQVWGPVDSTDIETLVIKHRAPDKEEFHLIRKNRINLIDLNSGTTLHKDASTRMVHLYQLAKNSQFGDFFKFLKSTPVDEIKNSYIHIPIKEIDRLLEVDKEKLKAMCNIKSANNQTYLEAYIVKRSNDLLTNERTIHHKERERDKHITRKLYQSGCYTTTSISDYNNSSGSNLMGLLIKNNRDDLLEVILEDKKISEELCQFEDNHGNTALADALLFKKNIKADIIEKMLKNGCNPNIVPNYVDNSAHLSLLGYLKKHPIKNRSMIKILKLYGAKEDLLIQKEERPPAKAFYSDKNLFKIFD